MCLCYVMLWVISAPGTCYVVNSVSNDFDEARQYCIDKGTTLARAYSQDDLAEISLKT